MHTHERNELLHAKEHKGCKQVLRPEEEGVGLHLSLLLSAFLHIAAVLIYWGYCEFLGDFPRKVILTDSPTQHVRLHINSRNEAESQAQSKEKMQTKKISRPPIQKRKQTKPQKPTIPQRNKSKASNLDLNSPKTRIDADSTTPNASPESARQARSDGGAGNRGEEKQSYLSHNFDYIRRKIQEHLHYPAVAMRMGWQGRVTLRFVLQKDGNVKSISVTQSSGFNILDKNAKEAVKKAAPFSPPPFPLEITLPVDYRLH